MQLGAATALSASGNTMVTCAPGYKDDSGICMVFVRVDSTSFQFFSSVNASTGVHAGSGAAEAIVALGVTRFGEAVSLSGDINSGIAMLLVGCPSCNGSAGAVFVYSVTNAGSWTQQAVFTAASSSSESVTSVRGVVASPTNGGSVRFGASVSLARTDGFSAAVGAPGNNGGEGGVFLFRPTGNGGFSAWMQQGDEGALVGSLAAAPGVPAGGQSASSGVQQGVHAALASDGAVLVFSGPGLSASLGGALWGGRLHADCAPCLLGFLCPASLCDCSATPRWAAATTARRSGIGATATRCVLPAPTVRRSA